MENFSPVDRAEIFSLCSRTNPLKIDVAITCRNFQPRLKIHKRIRRTPMYNNKYKKATVPALTFMYRVFFVSPVNRAKTQLGLNFADVIGPQES